MNILNILASALPLRVKIGIWQAHCPDLVDINLYGKNYQNILKVSRVIGIFANCHILTSALPRSRKSGNWQFFFAGSCQY